MDNQNDILCLTCKSAIGFPKCELRSCNVECEDCEGNIECEEANSPQWKVGEGCEYYAKKEGK